MSTTRFQSFLAYAHAQTEGREAAQEGKGIDANPYPEESECHWRWLNAWCNEETSKQERRPHEH